MYICICRAITTNKLEEVHSRNGGDAKKTLQELGVGDDCGICLEKALEAIDLRYQARAAQKPSQKPAKNKAS